MYWNIKEVDAPELARWLEKEGHVQVVDIRQPQEVAAGVVPGSEIMPMHTIPLRIREIKQDKPVVLVCRSGARSAQACMFLAQNGYDNVYNLRGGIIGWAGSGLQIAMPRAV